MCDYFETNNNERNLADEAPAGCRFEGSCIHRCKFRSTAKGVNLSQVPRFLAEKPDWAAADGIVIKEPAGNDNKALTNGLPDRARGVCDSPGKSSGGCIAAWE
jgi:hypothetical protein